MAESGGKRRFIEGGLEALFQDTSGMTSASAAAILRSHQGRWAQATGSVIDVTENPDSVAVSILLSNRRDLFLLFEKGDFDALFLHKDDEVTVQGCIAVGSSGGVSLHACEIVQHVSVTTLALRELQARADELTAAATARLEASRESVEESVEVEPEGGRTRNISTAEMRRFGQLYLQIWGDGAKEIPAWMAMKACYPDGIIGRDPFLKEFRELRGPGKRGNPAIRGK